MRTEQRLTSRGEMSEDRSTPRPAVIHRKCSKREKLYDKTVSAAVESSKRQIGLFSQRMRKLNQDENNIMVIRTNVLKTRRNERLSQEMILKEKNQ